MRIRIHHTTTYIYPRPVVNSVNEVWLRPLSDRRQACRSFVLSTSPPSEPRPYTDYFGNTVYHFDVPEPHERLEIVADADVETEEIDGPSLLESDLSPYRPLSLDETDRWLDFLAETPLTAAGTAVRQLATAIRGQQTTVARTLAGVAQQVSDSLRYETGLTGVHTTAEAALALGTGVCQDYTHLFLAISRSLGIPARYVSGYLATDEHGEEVQASHAWPEALLPAAGWIAFDPTNGRLVDGRYVRVAVGRDYADVPPVRGAYSGPSGNGLDVAVYVLNDQQQQQ